MNLDFEKMLAAHLNDGPPKFNPYAIAKAWPKSPVLGNASSAFIVLRLYQLGEPITLENIELIKICLTSISQYGAD